MHYKATDPHIILSVGDDGVVVTPCNIANAAPFFAPADAKGGMQEIMDFLGKNPKARVVLLVDNLAQDYRNDTLPSLNFFDRAQVAQRRLTQIFPTARLTAFIPRRKSRDQFLMIGLHESNPVFAWAERLRARQPTLHLLPLEGARIVTRLMPDAASGWAMLVSRHQSGGFRQIVTHNGDFIFTRLTPLPHDGTDEDENETIARDIKASLDYLSRHGLSQAADLEVLLLLPHARHTAEAFRNLPLKSVASLSPYEAGQKLNLPFAPHPHDPAGDLIFAAHLITASRPVLTLMLPEARQARQTQIIRKWGLRIAAVALALALGHTIETASDLLGTVWMAQNESRLLQKNTRALQELQASAAPITEPLGRLRQAVERRRIYEQIVATPWQGLNALAAGLGGDIKLTKLVWKKDSDSATESLTISLRMPQTAAKIDRAATVAAFTQTAQKIADSMPGYDVAITRTPYPDLPKDSVTTASVSPVDTIGEITAQEKKP